MVCCVVHCCLTVVLGGQFSLVPGSKPTALQKDDVPNDQTGEVNSMISDDFTGGSWVPVGLPVRKEQVSKDV